MQRSSQLLSQQIALYSNIDYRCGDATSLQPSHKSAFFWKHADIANDVAGQQSCCRKLGISKLAVTNLSSRAKAGRAQVHAVWPSGPTSG